MALDPGKGSASEAETPAGPREHAETHPEWVQYEVSFEFAPDCQMLTDGQGVILKANHAAAVLLRCPKEFLIGKPLGLFVAEGHRPRFYDSLSRLWQGLTSDGFETRLARRGEPPRDVLVLANAEAGRAFFRWLMRDVTELRRAEADRAELLRRIVTIQEDERRQIARDLHDNVGQLLTALSLGLKSVEQAGPFPPAVLRSLQLVRQAANELSQAIHNLSLKLRPVILDELGLHAVLKQLLSDWSASQPGIAIDFRADALAGRRLPLEVETAVFRMVQESLTNVFRHARASRVSVAVELQANLLAVAVTDNGVGFDSQAADPDGRKRLGLVGMRERAALAGGNLEVRSSPGQGTSILAWFPLPISPPHGNK
jgi:signal transduction histidine kinase